MSNSNFPVSLDAFINPGSSDSENTPPIPHHLQHGLANDAIAALELKVGVDNPANSITNAESLDYLIKNAANPGHIHTLPITTQNLTITGTTAQSGAGFWYDAAVLYITNTAGASGGIILRPQGPTSNVNQLLINANGTVATSNTFGAVRNTLDDGSGNSIVAGNMTVDGNLTVSGSTNVHLTYSNDETTTLSFDPAYTTTDGTSNDIARADHRHALPSMASSTPLPASSSPGPGSSLLPARADHIHPLEEEPGIVKMWPAAVSTIPFGYLNCDGTIYNISDYFNLAEALNNGNDPTQASTPFTPASPFYVSPGNVQFKVPDYQGVSPIGAGTSGAYASEAPSTRVLGNYYGQETTHITSGQLPVHYHNLTGGASTFTATFNHDHNFPTTTVVQFTGAGHSGGDYLNVDGLYSGSGEYNLLGNTTLTTSGPVSGNNVALAGHTDNAGSGTAVSIMSPVFAINFIIKT